jgi:KDO2-lipid IV(A) lauroyltransferase
VAVDGFWSGITRRKSVTKAKKYKRKIELILIDTLILLGRCLPRRAGMKLFTLLGAAASRIFKEDRSIAVRNLSTAFPDSPAIIHSAIVDAMYRTIGKNIYEFLNVQDSSKERLHSIIDKIEGESYLRQTFQEGRGIIAITGHIGCWELLGAHLVSRGYPVSVVARSLSQDKWQDAIESIRASVGVETINRDSGARAMLRSLRKGRILGVLMDQHTRVKGVYVPFFGHPAHTTIAVAKLAMISGAIILPMAIYINSRNKHVVRVLAPIDANREGLVRKDAVRVVTGECSQAIEKLIRYDPKQWIWWHDRWPNSNNNESLELEYAIRN